MDLGRDMTTTQPPPAENHESHGLGIRDASGMEDRALEDEEADVEGEEDI
jgi:hypothetical protein